MIGDFYVILGVEHRASLREIKRAYRRLARKYHPDINPGDRAAEARFRQIVEAYETLSDTERRRQYDRQGTLVQEGRSASVEFEGFDFSAQVDDARAPTFGELFADVFRRAQPSGGEGPADGADLHSTVWLTFEEAVRGTRPQVTVTRLDTCGACAGTGRVETIESRCSHCQGGGSLRGTRGHMVFSKPCPYCGGSGQQRHRSCRPCSGQGVLSRVETVTIEIPPGVADGMQVRLAGKGHAGQRGGRTGDLYVTARVAPDPLFRREGDDLYLTVPIAIHEAALGAKIDIPALEGAARLRIPPGTQSGQRFRLRGRGTPSPRDGRRGDLIVEVKIVLPPLADERSKELLREFGRINNVNVRKDLGV